MNGYRLLFLSLLSLMSVVFWRITTKCEEDRKRQIQIEKVKKLIVKRKKFHKLENLSKFGLVVIFFDDNTHWTFKRKNTTKSNSRKDNEKKMVEKLSCRLIRLNPEKILQINPSNTFFTNRKHFSLGLSSHVSFFSWLNRKFSQKTQKWKVEK